MSEINPRGNAGPNTPAQIRALLADVDKETEAEADPEWWAKYGENLAAYTHSLFGE